MTDLLVRQLRDRDEKIASAHERKSGKKLDRPFTLEGMAADEIERLRGPDQASLCVVLSEENDALIEENKQLRDALTRVLADIAEYERVNNLAPNPGRKYCWDSVAHAHTLIEK